MNRDYFKIGEFLRIENSSSPNHGQIAQLIQRRPWRGRLQLKNGQTFNYLYTRLRRPTFRELIQEAIK